MRPKRDAIVAGLTLAVLFVLSSLAGCGPGGTPASGGTNTYGEWSYVDGPHGEHCLIYSGWLGLNNGFAGMDCDTVNP